MEMNESEYMSYIIYAAIVVVFIIIMKMPKKEQGDKSEKKNISTSKKFNKDIKDQQNDIKDI